MVNIFLVKVVTHTGNKMDDLMEVYSYSSLLSLFTSVTQLFMREEEHASCCPAAHMVAAILWTLAHKSTWIDLSPLLFDLSIVGLLSRQTNGIKLHYHPIL